MIFSQRIRQRFFSKNRRSLVGNKMLGQLEPIAADAVQRLAYHAVSALLRSYPGAVDEWRIMTYMLSVAAIEYRDGVSLIVGIKSHDRSFHDLKIILYKSN